MRNRKTPNYRHRFTNLTDWLVSPYDLGFCLYNWGLRVLGGRKHEVFRKRVTELAELRGDERVLDARCGTGLTALRIAAQHPGCSVHGLDLSPRMIEVARKAAVDGGLQLDLRVGSSTDLPHVDCRFDVVLTNIVFHHLDMAEKQQAVAEIARVLRPGGRYVSAEFGPRARNALERRLAKLEYTLYPSQLTDARLAVEHEELRPFVWGLKVYCRVAVKSDLVAADSLEEG